MKKKSSVKISLVLAGTLALGACSEPQRDVYRSKEDCLKDWGREGECEQVTERNNAYGGHYYTPGFFYGPRYAQRAGISTRAVAVARGGFGKPSGFHSSFGG